MSCMIGILDDVELAFGETPSVTPGAWLPAPPTPTSTLVEHASSNNPTLRKVMLIRQPDGRFASPVIVDDTAEAASDPSASMSESSQTSVRPDPDNSSSPPIRDSAVEDSTREAGGEVPNGTPEDAGRGKAVIQGRNKISPPPPEGSVSVVGGIGTASAGTKPSKMVISDASEAEDSTPTPLDPATSDVKKEFLKLSTPAPSGASSHDGPQLNAFLPAPDCITAGGVSPVSLAAAAKRPSDSQAALDNEAEEALLSLGNGHSPASAGKAVSMVLKLATPRVEQPAEELNSEAGSTPVKGFLSTPGAGISHPFPPFNSGPEALHDAKGTLSSPVELPLSVEPEQLTSGAQSQAAQSSPATGQLGQQQEQQQQVDDGAPSAEPPRLQSSHWNASAVGLNHADAPRGSNEADAHAVLLQLLKEGDIAPQSAPSTTVDDALIESGTQLEVQLEGGQFVGPKPEPERIAIKRDPGNQVVVGGADGRTLMEAAMESAEVAKAVLRCLDAADDLYQGNPP